VTFDPWQPAGLDRAVDRALDRLPDLLNRALERRAAFIAFHNPERLARFVCGAAVLERAERGEATPTQLRLAHIGDASSAAPVAATLLT
jgi:hypothetical protein